MPWVIPLLGPLTFSSLWLYLLQTLSCFLWQSFQAFLQNTTQNRSTQFYSSNSHLKQDPADNPLLKRPWHPIQQEVDRGTSVPHSYMCVCVYVFDLSLYLSILHIFQSTVLLQTVPILHSCHLSSVCLSIYLSIYLSISRLKDTPNV
jgi:hypothetical protein